MENGHPMTPLKYCCSLNNRILVFSDVFCLYSLAKPSQLYFGGEVKDLKAMKSEDDIGSLVQYEFRVGVSVSLKLH